MVRFLSALDRLLSGILPALYLAGTAAATISYFSGGIVPDATAVTGVLLGFAVEAHTWLQVRRTREAWTILSRIPKDDPQRDLAVRQFKIAVGILALLGLFACWNSQLFLQAWHPASDVIPVVWQRLIRGAVIPVLILLSGVLVPLHEDPSAELAKASATILRQTLRDVAQQVKEQIADAKAQGASLAPIATALLLDAQDPRGARRLRTIHDGLRESRGEVVPSATGSQLDRPISLATHRSKKRKKTAADPEAQLSTVRRLLASDPNMPLSQIMKRARLSMPKAAELRKKILAEMGEQQQVAG